jgi:ankyrin repeat protein
MIPIQPGNDAAERNGCRPYEWNAGSRIRAGRLILCLLLVLGGSFPARGGEIHKAVIKGNLNKVVALLKDHSELIESKNNLGMTPLHLAVEHNQLGIAALLLANGANVDARDQRRNTPLILAMFSYNHEEMVRLLLAKGADVNLANGQGKTALAWAADRDQIDDAKILLANDADMEAGKGYTPLLYAVIGTHTDMVELLLANGADPNTKVGARSPLYYSKQMNYLTNQISDPKIEALLRKYGGRE